MIEGIVEKVRTFGRVTVIEEPEATHYVGDAAIVERSVAREKRLRKSRDVARFNRAISNEEKRIKAILNSGHIPVGTYIWLEGKLWRFVKPVVHGIRVYVTAVPVMQDSPDAWALVERKKVLRRAFWRGFLQGMDPRRWPAIVRRIFTRAVP